MGEWLDAGKTFGFPTPWEWHRDARGQTCAYESIDATGVRQQAADGSAAEGRMPYVAMICNPVPDLPADAPYQPPPLQATMQARYLAGLYDFETLGPQLRRQANQVGMDRAEQWLGLTDGGNGLDTFLQTHFPRDLVLILDFWHAAEYLRELAQQLHPQDETARQQHQQWCHRLKHDGGAALIAHLEQFPWPPRQPGTRAKLATTLHYFRNNVQRMDYPTYTANGWLIGSGAVESACKTMVGQRLRLAGMRWREEGTDAVCHLRALFKSEPRQ